jgi:hypothetical protein
VILLILAAHSDGFSAHLLRKAALVERSKASLLKVEALFLRNVALPLIVEAFPQPILAISLSMQHAAP